MKGIDISKFNQVFDYNKIKEDDIDFAIIRCTGMKAQYGGAMPYKDPSFEKHYAGCKAAGLYVGAYAYIAPVAGRLPREHAEFILNVLKGKVFEMPIYIDVEAWKQKDRILNTNYVYDVCRYLEEKGAFVGVYGSDISTFKDMLQISGVEPFTWWVARYGKHPEYAIKNLHIWQTTSTGVISGIKGLVDLDVSYLNFPKIIKKKNLNRF